MNTTLKFIRLFAKDVFMRLVIPLVDVLICVKLGGVLEVVL